MEFQESTINMKSTKIMILHYRYSLSLSFRKVNSDGKVGSQKEGGFGLRPRRFTF